MMTKTGLNSRCQQEGRRLQAKAIDAVEAFINQIALTLLEGEELKITGFGAFEVKTRAERQGHDPKTGEAVTIPAARVPAFRAGKALKDTVR